MNTKKVVHVINADKFTAGYVNFMKICFDECQHTFIFLNKLSKLDLMDNEDVIVIDSYFKVLGCSQIRNKLYQSDKIIISGVFGVECFFWLFPKVIWEKVYLHFWGGDFYQYENCIIFNISKYIHRKILKGCISKANAVIFLIDNEYDKFVEILKLRKKYFVAPMPGDPRKRVIFSDYRKVNNNSTVRIIVGNSATESNQHKDVFDLLKRYSDKDIEIYCPLSYGDEQYRKEVLRLGESIFQDKFHPLLSFMDKEEYKEFLSTCDVGIFNNNRQQGMANITMLLGMGKKVFLRNETSMWHRYLEEGNIFFDVEDIVNLSFEEFCHFSHDYKSMNEKIADQRDPKATALKQWRLVLEEGIPNE